MKKEDIARKIEALLNKTVERGATEGEALAAALKAQELMAKYDITTIEHEEEPEEVDSTDMTTTRVWERFLAASVCRNMRCQVIITTIERRSYMKIYGFETDRKAAFDTFMMLLTACRAGIKREKAKAREFYGETAGIEDAYAKAFIRAVNDEMSKASRALMLIVPEEVEDYINEKYPRLRQTSYMPTRGGIAASVRSAASAGYADGRATMGQRQLTAGS